MQYPLISEYVRAIQEAASNLDKLAHLEPVADKHGEPYRSSGAFAVVFKMRDPKTGRCYALKCFTEEQEGRAEAYRRIADELETVDSTYLTTVKYYEGELFVDSPCDDDCFPVLLMDWIEGETMEAYIAAHWRDTCAMSMLCYRFCRMAAWLRSQPFAHGDIKPDNVMVREDGTLALVDYDGMFVPAMKGQKSPTIGTKDFSHPMRTVDDFDETIDDFTLASIALSLKAMSLDPTLREKYGAADRLLFSVDDYRDPGKSAVLAALQPLLTDADLVTLLSMFLLAWSNKDLSQASFRLFTLPKPAEPEILRTDVTEADLAAAITDERGVKYSPDGLRLLKAPESVVWITDEERGTSLPVKGGSVCGNYIVKNGTEVICNSAFYGCTLFESIIITDSVTSIGSRAFDLCLSLASVAIPDGVTSIGNSVFRGCESLTSITIPSRVTNIGNGAFSGCSSLASIIIPNSVTSIGYGAFRECSSLTSITIPDNVTSIGDSAFEWCSSLASISIPNGITSIGEGVFGGCSSLTSVTIPTSVREMKGNPFYGWSGELIIKSPYFTYEDGVLFSKNKDKIIAFRQHKARSYVIPDSVTSIGDWAFSGCSKLTSITIPDSVTSIGDHAFSGCSRLTSITIPDNVMSIGNGTFEDCLSLTSITIPDSMTSIGYRSFGSCESLVSVTIPNSVKSIDNGAFCGCDSLIDETVNEIKRRFGYDAFLPF